MLYVRVYNKNINKTLRKEKMKKRVNLIFLALLILALTLTGCDIISDILGVDLTVTEIKITDPKNGDTISGTYLFIGTYSGSIDSVSLKIGEEDFSGAELSNGTWKMEIDLSSFESGEYTVTAIGYEGNKELKTYSIDVTIEGGTAGGWNDTEGGRYLIFKDPDYNEGTSPAKLTDITSDGENLYIAGYYMDTSEYKYKPFLYKIDPSTGGILASYISDAKFDYSTTIDPVLVTYESSNSSVYMAFSVEGAYHIYIKKLDENLKEQLSYDKSQTTDAIQFQRLISYNPGTETSLYLTGTIGSNILAYKIPDYGSNFGSEIAQSTGYEGTGYDLLILNSSYVYIAAKYYSSGTNYGAILELKQSDLTEDTGHTTKNTNVFTNGECFGLTLEDHYNYIYLTGYFKNGSGNDRSTALQQIYPPDLGTLLTNASFSYTSAPSSDINDEAGVSVIFDSTKDYFAICGFQKRTGDFSTARASVFVKVLGSDSNSYNEVKHLIFEVANYGESFLRDIIQLDSNYYAVGYAYDADNTAPNALIIEVTNSSN